MYTYCFIDKNSYKIYSDKTDQYIDVMVKYCIVI